MHVGQMSVEVNIVYREGMMWINDNRINLHIAMGLEGFTEFGYNVKEGSLGIVLDGALQYLEIPCSRREAEMIVSGVGWDVGRLHIQRE